jgi:UDP-glucose 6-dehydrogenase
LEKLGKELSLIIVLTDLSKIEVLKYITNSRPNYLALGISYFMHMFLTGVIMVIFSG